MALSRDELLDRVWVYLDNKTRKQYNEGELGDEDLLALGTQQGWIPTDFSQVEGSASTVPVDNGPTYSDRLTENTQFYAEDLESVINSLQGGVQSAGAGALQFIGDFSPAANVLGIEDPFRNQVDTLNQEAAQARARAEETLGKRDDLDWLALRTLQDVAASLPSLASLLSPATAPVAGGYIFGQEYGAARQGGVEPLAAASRAVPQAAAEFAFERLPIGRFADNLFPLADDLVKVPSRVAATAIAEGVSEGLTTQVQMGIDKLLSEAAPNEELRQFSRENLPQDIAAWWEETSRALAAGTLMGGGVAAPMQAQRVAAEKGKLAAEVLSTLDTQAENDERTRMARESERFGVDEWQERLDSELQALGADVESDLPDPFEDNEQANAFDEELLAESNAALAPMEPVATATPVEPVAPTKTPRKRKTVTEKQTEIKDTASFLDDLAKDLAPRRMGSEQILSEPTGVTTSDVGRAIVDRLGRGDAQTAARLLVNGNVRLVQSETDIPTLEEAKKTSTAGFYDGNQAYIVADHLDPKNIVGELLTVAAHEVKHGGDLAADPTLRTTLGEFIGTRANSILNQQIEALAAQGNPQAVEAVAAARDTNAYDLELPAYFISEARKARANTPVVQRVLNNVVSAVRTIAKQAIPGEYDVNLDDVAYLSDQLLKTTAIENPNLTENGEVPNFLQMIVGQRSSSFDEQERKGLVYRSRDGQLKTWMSDADSRINLTDRVTEEFSKPGKRLAPYNAELRDVLEHPTLFKEYPELGELSVNIEEMAGDALGSYNPQTKVIRLNSALLSNLEFNSPLHRILMHEIQHAVQDIEGFDMGTSPEHVLKVNPDYFANQGFINTATANIANLGLKVTQQDVVSLADELGLRTPEQHEALAAALTASNRAVKGGWASADTRGSETPVQISYIAGQEFISRLRNYPQAMSDRVVNLADTLEEISAAKTENRKLEDEAFKSYRAKLGETEARFTEQNIDLTEDWMEMQPGAASINPEVNFPETWQGDNPRSATSLSMAVNIIPHSTKIGTKEPKEMGEIERATKRLLLPGGGFEPVLNEINRHGASLPAALSVNATQLGSNFLSAVQQNAKRLHISEDQLREQLGRRIDSIDKMESRDARVSAVTALNRDYPGVGTALNDLREYKIGLTLELIALRKRDPKPLSKKEVAIYKKMRNNAERYTTRAYLATYNSDLGKLYGKHLLSRAKADPNSKEGKTLEAALQYLANNELVIPPADALAAMKSQQLRRLHKAWIGSTTRYKGKPGRAAMVSNLSNLPPRTQEMIDKKAMEVVRDLLGMNEKASSKLYATPSMRQQRTILEARTDLPEPLRQLMGEITDPILRESISLQRMINLATKTKVLTEIFEKGKDAGWWSDERTDAHQRELNNIAYGPMDGKWINKDVEDVLTGTILSMENLDSSLAELTQKPDAIMQAMLGSAFKPMRNIMSLQKTMKVVLSPINMLMNFGGALALMAPAQGIINPATYMKGMRDTAQVLGREITTKFGTPAQNATSAELLMAGVTDSATMGEFRGEQFQVIREQIEKMINDGTYTPAKMIKTVWKGVGEGANAARQAYAFMDVWVKASTYYDRKNFWQAFNEAEDLNMTDEQIIRRAGYEAAGTNVSYERAVPLARALEQNIPLAMFLTYFSETFRATAMSYAQAYKDFNTAAKAKTPKGKALAVKMGTTRLAGTLAATLGLQQAVMSMLDSEDEEEQKKRQLDADYMEDKVMIPMGLNDDGNEVMVELQRLDPIGPMNEFFIKVRRAPDDEKPQAAAQAVLDMFVESRGVIAASKLITDLMVHATAGATGNEKVMEWDARRKKNTVLERNYPEAYEWIRSAVEEGDIGENLVPVMEQLLLPTAVEPFVDAERTQVSEVREGDAVIGGEPIHDELRAFGYKAYVRDPHMSLTFRAMDYNDAINRLRQEANDLNGRAATMDPADLLENLNSIRSREKALFDDMYGAYEGFMAFDNTSAKEFNEIIDNKKLAADIRAGRFRSRLVEGDALERWYDRARKERGADKAALREEYQLLRSMYRESNRAAE